MASAISYVELESIAYHVVSRKKGIPIHPLAVDVKIEGKSISWFNGDRIHKFNNCELLEVTAEKVIKVICGNFDFIFTPYNYELYRSVFRKIDPMAPDLKTDQEIQKYILAQVKNNNSELST